MPFTLASPTLFIASLAALLAMGIAFLVRRPALPGVSIALIVVARSRSL